MIKPLLALIILSSYLLSYELIGKVVKVSDGDTITILTSDKTQHKIRLNDIDAPEKKQAFGNKSKDNLAKYIAGKTVTVEYQKKDKYKRILGTIYYNNTDINLQQVKDGYAWVYKKYSNNQTYYKAERIARDKRVGLWTDKKPLEPWEFRKKNK
ncbi:thermonuclease family protein [Arcobacter cryaerophilus gv. pseudocryaerophilus]|uniref:Thermonuclease family protein n=3 Tax=unclassified Arcobacter TaxID=2593671 RepID=A0AA96DN85_9BACT|nr:thermonuclease family protein [Arcobacter sp. AZ-2023]WPD04830.1 thermonuclease family protein [Arcobacter sp. DSM 115956]WPD06925.1 thermonuclease family protein [Arcobacter sp. DSM 115955]WNL31190.1 thermonuclease family protein [Arcobacter sp. AZ-2023]WNP37340.1 thermonuclease family protein [Arcobacter sp. AZ-2023]